MRMLIEFKEEWHVVSFEVGIHVHGNTKHHDVSRVDYLWQHLFNSCEQ